MLIDWFTVIAQVINFFILVWLMKIFLYKPIFMAINEREKLIATKLADAEQKKIDAQKASDEFKYKNEQIDQEREALLTKATEDAKTERKRLLAEAREEVNVFIAKRQETLKNDAHNLNEEISLRIQQEVFAIARKTLTDLAGISLEQSMVSIFLNRLQELNNNENIVKLSSPLIIRSAFVLSIEQQAEIQFTLNKIFSAEIVIQFEVVNGLISGIELISNGQKLAWSISDYLVSLEKSVEGAIEHGI